MGWGFVSEVSPVQEKQNKTKPMGQAGWRLASRFGDQLKIQQIGVDRCSLHLVYSCILKVESCIFEVKSSKILFLLAS